MPPLVPDEIDLFTLPHSRMKELVNTYTQKVQHVDFRDCHEAFTLLRDLQTTLYEFKSHECIENLFIMDQLKIRLKQRHIYNSAVCNCHNDNRLSEMLNLVKHGKHLPKCTIGERLNFGQELQKSFLEFVQQFLPHMEEEENIFQPLLVEHFEYDELRALKEVVIEQHELIKDPQYQEKAELDLPEVDSAIKDFRDIDSNVWSLADLYNETKFKQHEDNYCTEVERYNESKVTDENSFAFEECSLNCKLSEKLIPTKIVERSDPKAIIDVPSEILIKIFAYLTPPDRGKCAQVCARWNEIVFAFPLWKIIYPVQWAKGIWAMTDKKVGYDVEDEALKNRQQVKESWKFDEDADIDESEHKDDTDFLRQQFLFDNLISFFLPKIGRQVEKIILDGGTRLTSRQIRQILILCPNVNYLSAAYTSFDYYTLKGLWTHRSLQKLKYLDLQGCENINDECLYMLAECLRPPRNSKRNCPINICLNNYPTFSIDNDKKARCLYCPFSLAATGCSGSLGDQNLLCDPKDNCSRCPFLKSQPNCETSVEIEELQSFKNTSHSLEYLNLSGSFDVTEVGLNFLLCEGLLDNLSHLNLSSCYNISGIALNNIVTQCPDLPPQNLSYCNRIMYGPYPSLANGCDNLDHPIKVCCRARLDL